MYNVLYVDDEPGLLEIGKLFLEQSGQFSIDITTSARDALTLLNTKTYDAIISDYKMPDIDGIAFLKMLKGSGNTLPFILFTGRGREEVVIDAINSGADFYLQKGGDPTAQFAELAHKIRQAVSRRQEERAHEYALRESEEKYRILVETSFDGIVIHQDGLIVYANATAFKLMGAEKSDEIIGKPLLSFVHPAYRELVRKRSVSATEENLPVIQEKFIRKNGSVIDVDVVARPFAWRNKPAVHVVFRDVTARRKAEEALRDRESKMRAIFDSTFQFTGMMTPEGILTDANRTALSFIGARMEDVINLPFWETPWWKGDEAGIRELQEGIRNAASGNFVRYEAELQGLDHTTMQVDFSLKPVFGADNSIRLLIIEARDITERKQYVEALKSREAQLRQIIDLVPHMIFAKDYDGKYILANRAVAEGYNTTVNELEGKSHALFHKDEEELRQMLEDDREVIATGQIKFIPEELDIDAYGNQRHLQTTKVPFSLPGCEKPAVLGVAIDITGHRQTELELREKNKQLAAAQEERNKAYRLAQIGIWEWSRDADTVILSDELYRMIRKDTPRHAPTHAELERYFTPEELE